MAGRSRRRRALLEQREGLFRLGGFPWVLFAKTQNSLLVKFCLHSSPGWRPMRSRRSDSLRLFFKTDAFLYSQNWLG